MRAYRTWVAEYRSANRTYFDGLREDLSMSESRLVIPTRAELQEMERLRKHKGGPSGSLEALYKSSGISTGHAHA